MSSVSVGGTKVTLSCAAAEEIKEANNSPAI